MEQKTAVVVAAIVIIVIILAAWYAMSRGHGNKSGFGAGLGHGRPPLGGGSRLEDDIGDGSEYDDNILKEGLGGRRGRGGRRHRRTGSGQRHGGHAPRHWHLLHRRPFRQPVWWNYTFDGRPWWSWWQTNPALANSWVVNYPGYCDWCALCDNLDPDSSSDYCASCELYCPYGTWRYYGL